MTKAVLDARNDVAGYETLAKRYNVPVATLYRKSKREGEESEVPKKKLGRFVTIFTKKQEHSLIEHVLAMQQRLFGLTYTDLRRLVFEFAERNQVAHTFNREKGMAGRDWLYEFLNKYKQIPLRQPENISSIKASGFNKPVVSTSFYLLTRLIDEYKFRASRVYNCDKTSISIVPNKLSKILTLDGKKTSRILSN